MQHKNKIPQANHQKYHCQTWQIDFWISWQKNYSDRKTSKHAKTIVKMIATIAITSSDKIS